MLELQKDWAVMKEGSGTEKKKDGGRADDTQRNRWYEKRKKNTEEKDQLEIECEWKKTVTKSIQSERNSLRV